MIESLKSHFLNLYAMALTDSQFDEKEIHMLYKLSEDKGISRTDLDNLLLNPASVKFHFPETLSERIEYLYDYSRMILADDHIDEEELTTLRKFCLRMGFTETNTPAIIDLLLDAARNSVPTAEIIEFVTQNAT
jgi:hypothetical protein